MRIIDRETGATIPKELFEEICRECSCYHTEARKSYPCNGDGVECCNLVEVE